MLAHRCNLRCKSFPTSQLLVIMEMGRRRKQKRRVARYVFVSQKPLASVAPLNHLGAFLGAHSEAGYPLWNSPAKALSFAFARRCAAGPRERSSTAAKGGEPPLHSPRPASVPGAQTASRVLRMARPRKDRFEQRSQILHCRLLPAEYIRIHRIALAAGKSVSDYVRARLLDARAEIAESRKTLDPDLFDQLRRIGVNLNQRFTSCMRRGGCRQSWQARPRWSSAFSLRP